MVADWIAELRGDVWVVVNTNTGAVVAVCPSKLEAIKLAKRLVEALSY